MASKIRKGDNVVVLKGRARGKKGKVLKIDTKSGRALVQGVNMVKRHFAPKQSDPGGIREIETLIELSNIALEDPKGGAPTRVGFRFLEDGRKVRFAKRSGEVIDE